MFAAGHRQSQLQRLEVSAFWDDSPLPDEWCLDSADFAAICSSCPRLQHLDITNTIRPGDDLSGLRGMPSSCTSLVIGEEALTGNIAAIVQHLNT